MKRVLCVWLPDFPIQRVNCEPPDVLRSQAADSESSPACVLYSESANRAHVVTASSEAVRHGIRPGMSLAEAQALMESAVFLPHEAQADARALNDLAQVCCRYSPFVGLECRADSNSSTTHCLLLDITGCAHLFGDESGLARQLVIDLAERGYFAHVAAANTIGAAWAIARYGHGTGSDRRLRSLPVEALRIPDQVAERLHEFDLHTIGRLLALPKDSLPSRFGTVLTERLDQMFGLSPELLVPVPRPEPVSAEWATDEPICHRAAVHHVCSDLLAEILDAVRACGEGLLRLTLSLHSETAEPAVLDIGLTRPADSLPHLMNLLRLKLETSAVPEWLHTIRLETSVTALLQIRQRKLFAHEEPARDEANVRRLLDRLTARLGPDAVVRPRLLPEAVPEQAVDYVATSGPIEDSLGLADRFIASARPLELFSPPQPVDVTSIVPDGPPVRFFWNRREYRIAHCTEVERIHTGWWQDTGPVNRQYCQVETRTGSRFWLFRNGTGEWFLHGIHE